MAAALGRGGGPRWVAQGAQQVARLGAAAAPRWAPQGRHAHLAGGGRTCDVVVIGAGVIGCACALELRRNGFSTINVDAHPSPGYGSTSSSSAIIRHFYSMEQSCRLAWESYHCWKAWADHLEAGPGEELCSLLEVGIAALDSPSAPPARTYVSKVRAACESIGIPVEDWDERELQRRIPYMSTSSYFPPRRIDDERFGEDNGGRISGALFCAQSGYVNDPQLAARNLADAVARKGGGFRWKSKVVGIERDPSGSRVSGVALEDGSTISAPIVINVAGPHSPLIHGMAFEGANVSDDTKVRAKPLKVEVAYVPEPPDSRIDETLPVVADIDVGIYCRPQRGGTLVVGSVEPECDELHFLSSPEDLRESLTDEWTNLVYRAALRFPSLRVPNVASGLTALYDTTDDWMPIYDRTALGGFYSMRGTSGNQFKCAPVAGRICARLVDRCENGHDHDKEPLELPLQHTPGQLNLGTWSRLRDAGSTSSTVLS